MVDTNTFSKQGSVGEMLAENLIVSDYLRSWDTDILLFGIYLFWLGMGLEK